MAKLHHSKTEMVYNSKRAKTQVDSRDIFDKALEQPHEQQVPLGGAGVAKAKALRTRGANTIDSLSPGRAVGHGYTKRSS